MGGSDLLKAVADRVVKASLGVQDLGWIRWGVRSGLTLGCPLASSCCDSRQSRAKQASPVLRCQNG
jgi:hypothetical protein